VRASAELSYGRLTLVLAVVACAPSQHPSNPSASAPLRPITPSATFLVAPSTPRETGLMILAESASVGLASVSMHPDPNACLDGPFGRTGVWRPDTSLVQRFDSVVVRVVDSTMAARGITYASSAATYHRQYAGLELFARRLVFVNGAGHWPDSIVYALALERSRGDSSYARLALLEFLSGPLRVADAGWGNWGVLFDPVTGRFGEVTSSCSMSGLSSPPRGRAVIPPAS
jgi:hypothetical protein